jgi:hypothetical protein
MQTVKTIIRINIVAAGILLTSGCAGFLSTGEGSVTPGSVVQVKQPIEIPDNKHRVYIQFGEFISYKSLDEGSSYCSFLMQSKNSKRGSLVTVAPENFEVVKVSRSVDESSSLNLPGRYYARNSETVNVLAYKLDMRLKSEQQPEVRSLICAKHVIGYGNKYPKLEEMNEALGDIINIVVPTGSEP